MDLTFRTKEDVFNFRVCGLLIHEDRLLTMRDSGTSLYYLPGGRVQFCESAEAAVVREIQEELDIHVSIRRALWLNQSFFTMDGTTDQFHEICIYYLMDFSKSDLLSRGGSFTRTEGERTHHFHWMPFEQLKNAYFYPLFLKKEIYNLPKWFTPRLEIQPHYRPILSEELTVELFRNFRRHQEVTQCWRKENGQWVIRPVSFTEDWGEKEFDFVCHCLKNTIATGGQVWGAFHRGNLRGIVSVECAPMGSRGQYREMTCLHVTEGLRGQGIGRELFARAKEAARELGGEKLYISSHSSVESQAFYKAMGCVEAEEYSAIHVEREPFDCQIECKLWEKKT